MDKAEIIKSLQGMHGSELIDVLRQVFPTRMEVEKEENIVEYRMFLGVAIKENIGDDEDYIVEWGPWILHAVAYADEKEYGKTFTGEPFLQYGRCENCNIEICSHVTKALCPICGNKVYLT
jgi:hypothetical protein